MNVDEVMKHGVAGLAVDVPNVDSRGSFSVSLPYGRYQLNTVYSEPRVLRGMHFQEKPFEQHKFVRVLRGTIMDVILDLETGEAKAFQLTADSPWLWAYVSPHYAHGYTTKFGAIVEYAVVGQYSPSHERVIRWDSVPINWRGLGVDYEPVLSEKDRAAITFEEYKKGVKG